MITKLRSSKILIEMPKEDSEIWIHITVQKIYKDDDGSIINIIPRWDYISFPLDNIGTQFFNFDDPVSKLSLESSGYGIASALDKIVIKYMLEHYNGTITPEGDLII